MWRAAAASVAGTSHNRSGKPCQDRASYQVIDDVLIAAVADGAGSAPQSHIGAQLVVNGFIRRYGRCHQSLRDWPQLAHDLLAARAHDSGLPIGNYACTFLGIVATPHETMIVQVGDGAIVIPDADGYRTAVWPQHGEYINTTNFLTLNNVMEAAEFRVEPPITELAMFTDGIERLILDYGRRTVHAPAIAPILHWLRNDNHIDHSAAIAAYLQSTPICSRTDDDTTLLVAVRQA